jgi:hypothetical protein
LRLTFYKSACQNVSDFLPLTTGQTTAKRDKNTLWLALPALAMETQANIFVTRMDSNGSFE